MAARFFNPKRLALLWALVILLLTLMPSDDVPAWPWAARLDKLVHAVLFSVQALLLGLALIPKARVRTAALVALLAAIAYGGAIELLQAAMGMGRSADVMDLLADAAGAGIAYAILRIRHSARA